MYSIIYFLEVNSVESVPSSWVTKVGQSTYCYWPNKKAAGGISNLIKKCVPHDTTWNLIKCTLVFKAVTYQEMRGKCEEASYLTMSETVDSDHESVGSKIQSDDSEVELPEPPHKTKKMEKDTAEDSCRGKCNCNSNYRNLTRTMLTMEKTLGKVESRLTQFQHSSLEAHESLHKEVVNSKEEMVVLKRMLKKPSLPYISANFENLPNLPVKSQENLNALEEVLRNELEQHNLVTKLQNFGGSTLRSTVNNVMRNTIASEVALLYSLQGKLYKQSFIELKTCKCIQGEITN